jgi:hypothetical protein
VLVAPYILLSVHACSFSAAILGGVLEAADSNIDWKFRQPREIQLMTDMDFRVAGIRELFVRTSPLAD